MKLRVNFPGSELIDRNYSQAGQDMFVLGVLQGKTNGRYVEIGSNEPTYMSNTYLLEKTFNYKGIGLDKDPTWIDIYNNSRLNKTILSDATTADYINLFNQFSWEDKIIDYASVDCEPPEVTFRALQKLISSDFKFRVITFEQESYYAGYDVRNRSRDFLTNLGYELIVGGVQTLQGQEYEDWWVYPELVDMKIANKFKSSNKRWIDIILET